MFIGWIDTLFPGCAKVLRPMAKEEQALEAEFAPLRRALHRAGLKEELLRRMTPDERVAALEQACLDPYDYIYLAC